MVIFTIIVVITSNLIRKITLNMLFSVPCCEVHQIFFFLALHGNAFSYHNFEIERSQYCKWYVPRTPNSSFYFPKASCNCWKRFSAYTFPRFIFNLRTLRNRSCGFVAWLRTVALSKFQWVCHTNPVQALNVARLHLAVLGGRVLCVNKLLR